MTILTIVCLILFGHVFKIGILDGVWTWIFIDWLIMTTVLKNTEEKWLINLYGEEYAEYKKHVNRCMPWKRKKYSLI